MTVVSKGEGIPDRVDRARLEADIRFLTALPSRIPGYPGAEAAAEHVERAFVEAGLENVSRQSFAVAVPVQKYATLEIAGIEKEIPLGALWPNGVRTATVPEGGITGPLMYAGDSPMDRLEGSAPEGAAVVMELGCDLRWLEAVDLGAGAILFLGGDAGTERTQAEMKFLSVPIPVPRFWVPPDWSDTLRVLAKAPNKTGCRIQCRVEWQQVEACNIVGLVPGTEGFEGEPLVVEGYYDSMSVVPARAPGAQGAATAAGLLELARVLGGQHEGRSIVFVACGAHYLGLGGAAVFFRRYSLAVKGFELPDQVRLSEVRRRGDDSPESSPSLGAFYRQFFRPLVPEHESQLPLVIGLELALGSRKIGIFDRGHFFEDVPLQTHRRYLSLARRFDWYTRQYCKEKGLAADRVFADAISAPGGRTGDSYLEGPYAFDAEVAAFVLPAVTLATCNGTRHRVDTPDDRYEGTSDGLEELVGQVRLAAHLVASAAADRELPKRWEMRGGMPGYLMGKVVHFAAGKSLVPDEPVAGAVVQVMLDRGYFEGTITSNPKPLQGVHLDFHALSNDSGDYHMETMAWPGMIRLDAFTLGGGDGEIDRASNLGVEGDWKYNFHSVPMWLAGNQVTNIVTFPCVPLSLLDLVDPRSNLPMHFLQIIDADTGAEPSEFGVSLPVALRQESSYWEPCGAVFLPRGSRVKLTMSLGMLGKRLLLLGSSADHPEGKGLRVEGPRILRGVSYRAAGDMWQLNDSRLGMLESRGIRNERMRWVHEEAGKALARANEERTSRRWATGAAWSRRAWAEALSIYPRILAAANDTVRAVLLYMILVIPFSVFCERLLFSWGDLRARIAATAGIFLAVSGLLATVHPAFRITLTPFLIYLAFAILSLGTLVGVMILRRFARQLEQLWASRRGIQATDFDRFSAALVAFGMGVSHLRRRRMRTALTCASLVLLTFAVLSLTSVQRTTECEKRALGGVAAYDGALFRRPGWVPLTTVEVERLEAVLGGDFITARRVWRGANRSGELVSMELSRTDGTGETVRVSAVLGLDPEESAVLGIDRTVINGRWLQKGERDVCLVPSTIERALKLGPDLSECRIRMQGRTLEVVGVYDEQKVNGLLDLNQDPISPANLALHRSAAAFRRPGSNPAAMIREDYAYYPGHDFVIMPAELLLDSGGTFRSVAARWRPREADEGTSLELLEQRLRGLARESSLGFLAGSGGGVYRFGSAGSLRVEASLGMVVPMVLCALNVLSAMLGTVYERRGEIATYASVGLSPIHIAFLFVAESCVYGVISAISGYTIGQVAAKVISGLGVLPGLTLNYSSSSAALVVLSVLLVTLVSSLYPARVAFRMAVTEAGGHRRDRGPVGDRWEVDLPFIVREDDATAACAYLTEFLREQDEDVVGHFVARDVQPLIGSGAATPRPGIRCMVWLAPYDLGVSQRVEIVLASGGEAGALGFRVVLVRASGDTASWVRLNGRFLKTLRKVFLVWQTLEEKTKSEYRQVAEETKPGAKRVLESPAPS